MKVFLKVYVFKNLTTFVILDFTLSSNSEYCVLAGILTSALSLTLNMVIHLFVFIGLIG